MADIAILGFGTVGSGVYETIIKNQRSIDKRAQTRVRVKRVLDLRDFPGSPAEPLLTRDFDEILFDDDIKIIVEVMGGVEPAYRFAREALTHGKSVVTSNKELVARHGAELLALAKAHRLNFLFEASVGGGIPIIRPLNKSLAADEISEISGILNGTTNYILTRMQKDGAEFAEALAEAQRNGYAERDPSADVLGLDACRKLAILLSLAVGDQADAENIHTEGITNITKVDMLYARAARRTIKLLAFSRIDDAPPSAAPGTSGAANGASVRAAYAIVAPCLVPDAHPLASVGDVFNAIYVKGNIIGEVMFYGRGAGKLPTASAVVADIVDALKHPNAHIPHGWSMMKAAMRPISELPARKFIRTSASAAAVRDTFGDVEFVAAEGVPAGETAFITAEALGGEIDKLAERAGGVISSIRLY
ncbi:MAG: homoserine dehydrogenase [Clostridiales bacterium]|nr:homoserine dehydrogenase [Clostridiales bacterium]